VCQRGRTGQRTGFADEHLQVVVQDEDLATAGGGTLVSGGLDPPVEDDQLRRSQVDPDPTPDQPGLDRVLALPDADPCVAVHPSVSTSQVGNGSTGTACSD
jgi:hypothetical protein